jgi:hypothetical protein
MSYLYSDVFFYVPIIGNETDELTYELFSQLNLLYYNLWNRECINKQLVGTLKADQLIHGALNFMVLRVWIL